MENALYEAGARRVGDICIPDVRMIENHPVAAAQWANEWVTALS